MSDKAPTGETQRQLQQESMPYRQKGSGVVRGTVSVQTPSGPVVATLGTRVLLAPATQYSTVRFDKFVVEDNEVPPAVRAAVVWSIKTDAQGNFTPSRSSRRAAT